MADDRLFDPAAELFLGLQDRIVAALERLDGGRFRRDDWTRLAEQGADETGAARMEGWGRTCVLEGGAVLEKAGVNFSKVGGQFAEGFASTMPGEGLDFRATGISLVLHPRNPYVPIVHMNYRRLGRGSTAWFGGGADLTPAYFDRDDALHFHDAYRQACEGFGDVVDWPTLVRQCDAYFFLPHRGERRGVGGIFFDYATADPDRMFAFVQAAGAAFLPSWLPIAKRHHQRDFGEAQRQWQLVRRGRYAEFNLVYDRGTTFGLRTSGRVESILMSLPPLAAWRYEHRPEPGSPEAATLEVLRAGFAP